MCCFRSGSRSRISSASTQPYCPGSALLQILVHLDSPELLKKYVLFQVGIEESYIVGIDAAVLPRNWRSEPAPGKVQKIGDEWAARATSPVLRVPSTLVPGESNFLLNPRHAGFLKLQFSEPLDR